MSDFNLDGFHNSTYRGERLTYAKGTFPSPLPGSPDLMLKLELGPHGPAAYIECSIPRLLHGHNLHVAAVDDTVALVRDLVSRAESLVEWDQPVHAMRVMRIDITKDFRFQDHAHVDAFIEGQRLLTLPYRPDVQTWEDKAGYTNLQRGNRQRWRMSLYSKEQELASQHRGRSVHVQERVRLEALIEEAQGVLRSELQLRRPVLKQIGVDTVADLSDDTIQSLHQRYFRRAGLDREVGGIDKVQVARMLANSEQQKGFGTMLGLLFLEARNLPSGMSHNTEVKYRKMARDLGLSAADLTGTQHSVRLDYGSGVLVAGDSGF